MIYEQPVVYEFKNISVPTLIIVGEADHTFLGRDLVEKDKQNLYGNFPVLADKAKEKIRNCEVIKFPGVGHIPHVQESSLFNKQLLNFLQQAD